jgi:hypothetical protein
LAVAAFSAVPVESKTPSRSAGTDEAVKTVYVVAKCHLDVGFTDTERNVLLTYFDDYIPRAIELARTLRSAGREERYVWTIAAWMIYEYLEQASPKQRLEMEQAVASGDIAWHALPFTWQSEMLDRSLLSSALKISARLDQRFGKRTTAGKLTDVPGHTRGLIAPLADAGIEFLDIGDNPGCRAPAVPILKGSRNSVTDTHLEDSEPLTPQKAKIVAEFLKYGLTEHDARRLISDSPVEPAPHLFNWRNPDGAQVMVLYHPLGYGSTTAIPGTDIAVSIRVAVDNSGPHSADEVRAYYAFLRRKFPGAKILATDLTTVGKQLQAVRSELPVVTQEIGDTWIYGVGSDPGKVARYRELSRLRKEWLLQKRLSVGDALDLALSARLILAAEHNWGLSTGQYLKHPEIYSPAELTKARVTMPAFQKVDDEWNAKRRNVDIAMETLPADMQMQAQLRLKALAPTPPRMVGARNFDVHSELKTANFIVRLDPASGAIVKLKNLKTGRDWASPEHPLASFRYETFTSADFARFNAEYNTAKFAANDFGKPGLERYPVESRTWQPRLTTCAIEETERGHRLIAEMQIPLPEAPLRDLVTWPRRMTLENWFPSEESAAHLTFQCFDKRANRLPEAMWLSFSPDAPEGNGWLLEKVEQPVSPLDVIVNGNRHLHAVTKDVTYRDANGSFLLESLDAPLVAPGQRRLLRFDNDIPDMREGVHVNLYNNLWGTAFPQWYEQDMRFRFILRA